MKQLNPEIDVIEDDILKKYPEVLNVLLCDRTTNKNIFWATDNYKDLGSQFHFSSPIEIDLITGVNGKVIMPRVAKNKTLQHSRVKDMAEVYTPAWICNAQNNLVDKAWFGKKDVFNKEVKLPNDDCYWKANNRKITFPKNKTWKDYIKDIRLEISCGEAPYIASRYDATTGELIPIKERIGMLDRKLRVINENVESANEWLEAALIAYKSIYAYEWQGDSLLLAREAMLYTFIENYELKFNKNPSLKSIQNIADIISWNVWQMDGIKGVLPNSCTDEKQTIVNLFGEQETTNSTCIGCDKGDILKHTGVYCLIKDWSASADKNGRKLRFIDLIQN